MKHTSITSSLVLFLLPVPIPAAVGGRCSGSWDDGQCIWSPWDWPCPNDPTNVWGCHVSPCPGFPAGTTFYPVCPGGNDFVCCRYPI
ncbi:hypothetical protein C8A03DRAFT_42203 [Achaetomium macrosporum]|uniref:Secreted protein n=1 Tax=Achaetomium macrosporum TaxID=79813 RepID=A0AAN7CG25_9PEZI|nr:hypothetical protein C8A03DRAFT_42203 [Achaetomium macrosporum]